MITLPADILAISGWDGKSTVTQSSGKQVEYDNLESAMTFAEHQRVVLEARALLTSYSDGASGFGGSAEATAAKAAFSDLKNCYVSTTSPHVLYISKGIHQRDTDAHLQVVLKVPTSDKQRKFHLNVTATRLGMDLGSGNEKKFVWGPVQFLWKGETTKYSWPLAANRVTRPRGSSLSLSDHIDRANAIAAVRAREEFNALLKVVTAQHGLGFINKVNVQKLYAGEAVTVKATSGPKQTATTKTITFNKTTKKFAVS